MSDIIPPETLSGMLTIVKEEKINAETKDGVSEAFTHSPSSGAITVTPNCVLKTQIAAIRTIFVSARSELNCIDNNLNLTLLIFIFLSNILFNLRNVK
ncbi:MAG TPA: hypothetical protein C5S37_10600 [Methanophagales archaeon]|nr:hypothetical protein [Methanophagales archaeon]